MGDGDAMGDVAYSYQYGIGVRRNVAAARRLYLRAIKSRDVSVWGSEEALYHLGVTYLDAGKPRLAMPYLKRAAKDGDFPEATASLRQIAVKGEIEVCRCRRFINKDLRGHAKCSAHPHQS
jgi:TPR repeat protein